MSASADRLADHLVTALTQHLSTGKPPRLPEAGRVLWRCFVEISASRTYHAAGPHPLAHVEIEAWCRLHRWPLQPRHIAIVRALDDAWLKHVQVARPGAATRSFPKSGPAMTPEFFDAVFG